MLEQASGLVLIEVIVLGVMVGVWLLVNVIVGDGGEEKEKEK